MLDGCSHDLLFGHLQFELPMDRTGREEHVNPWFGDPLQSLGRSFNIFAATAGQTTYCCPVTELLRDSTNRFEVTRRRDRESRFDHVDTQFHQCFSNLQFFGHGHTAARRLLAITKCGIEDGDGIGHGGVGHENSLSR